MGMKFNDLTVGQLMALVTKCGGPDRSMLVLRDELVVTAPPKPKGRTMKVMRPAGAPVSKSFSVLQTLLAEKEEVKISSVDDNFRASFGSIVEMFPIEKVLAPNVLVQTATDQEIVDDLGGEASAAVELSQVWRLMERQGSGEAGVLATSAYANVFYCCDVHGVLRVVHIRWYNDGWNVRTYPIGLHPCPVGDRVFFYSS